MVELELFLDESMWNQSWLLSEVQINSGTETFSGTITAEVFSWVDPETVRAAFTVEACVNSPPIPTPSVVTSHSRCKALTPSAGTSWPIPNNTEILLSQNIAIGTLYNHAMQDPVQDKNYSQHILRANEQTEFLIDDAINQIKFKHGDNQFKLDKNISFINPQGNIFINAHDVNYQSQNDIMENAGRNITYQTTENYSARTQSGNIAIHTSQLNNHAKQNIFLTAKKELEFKSNAINLTSEHDINFQSTECLTLQSHGSVEISGNDDISIIGEKAIILSLNGNTIEITSDRITITANQVTVSGQLILSVMPT